MEASRGTKTLSWCAGPILGLRKPKVGLETPAILLAESAPNNALHLTASSVRSCVAPASGSR